MDRSVALEILIKYVRDHGYLNILLNDRLQDENLSRKDKDFITKIVYGTVQNKMYLEYQLQPYIEDKKVHIRLQMILLMSLYQLIYLDKVPEYAVIDEAVRLANKKDRYAGKFVNAILRNYLRNGVKDVTGDKATQLSITTSHPLWLVNMLLKQYGEEATIKICESSNKDSTRVARVNTLCALQEEILQDPLFTKGKISEDAVYLQSGNIADTAYFKTGKLTIQDESSQLVARLLSPQPGDYVLDMCCAPGSKTTHLSALMNNTGTIIACDIFEHKLNLVRHNAKRMHATNITCLLQDATLLDERFEEQSFDCILLDAPCSGLGVLRRKPEIKYHDSSAMDTIIPLQLKLLKKAYYLLKNNGKMVYSTCTINKKENEFMIQKFIEQYSDMKIIEEKCILPYEYDSDGFYMCKLEKGN